MQFVQSVYIIVVTQATELNNVQLLFASIIVKTLPELDTLHKHGIMHDGSWCNPAAIETHEWLMDMSAKGCCSITKYMHHRPYCVLFRGLKPVLDGFNATMLECACKAGSPIPNPGGEWFDVLFAQAREHCDKNHFSELITKIRWIAITYSLYHQNVKG